MSRHDLSPSDPAAALRLQPGPDADSVQVMGDLTVRALPGFRAELARHGGALRGLDLSGLGRFDTAGAWALAQLRAQAQAQGSALTLTGLRPEHAELLARIEEALPQPDTRPTPRLSPVDLLARLGKGIVGMGLFVADIAGMLGVVLARLFWLIRHPRQFPTTALVCHADQVGWRAVPIVSLLAFLIGVVLAFQGAVQLRRFGAEIFVIDLIAISVLRELGILLTAIIVAGRTASSFTAAIGSMKMREEIDAMRTLAIDPVVALFVPRILALLITLPILGMLANAMGLLGGAIMAWIELGIPPGLFWAYLIDETSPDHVLVGFVKAPVFAMIIGVIGCHAGMQVQGNAESLGAQTSGAVVRAIFAVIVADALFSVFFAMMDI